MHPTAGQFPLVGEPDSYTRLSELYYMLSSNEFSCLIQVHMSIDTGSFVSPHTTITSHHNASTLKARQIIHFVSQIYTMKVFSKPNSQWVCPPKMILFPIPIPIRQSSQASVFRSVSLPSHPIPPKLGYSTYTPTRDYYTPHRAPDSDSSASQN
jgi:hypothetical protein